MKNVQADMMMQIRNKKEKKNQENLFVTQIKDKHHN